MDRPFGIPAHRGTTRIEAGRRGPQRIVNVPTGPESSCRSPPWTTNLLLSFTLRCPDNLFHVTDPAQRGGNAGIPAVGMVGGGQLARMTQQAAIGLGVTLRVLGESPQDSAARVVADPRLGDHRSLDDLRTFAKDCDVITWDHEHVPGEHIRALEEAGTA